MAVIKEFNLRQQFETKHQEKMKNLSEQHKLQKIEELKKNLTAAADIFHQSKLIKCNWCESKLFYGRRDRLISLAIYPGKISEELHDEGVQCLASRKHQILSNVSRSRNTVVDQVCEMATDFKT